MITKILIDMNFISDVLFWISNGLLVPVIVLLILLFVRALVLLVGFFGQYAASSRTASAVNRELNALTSGNLSGLRDRLPASKVLLVGYLHRIIDNAGNAPAIHKLLADFEVDADKELSVSRTLSKLGPMLGLMGTLIPMGPALVGLSTGDISSMAYNMQVAFATTVVGLFSSAVGFITQQARQRWYQRDLSCLEMVAEMFETSASGRLPVPEGASVSEI